MSISQQPRAEPEFSSAYLREGLLAHGLLVSSGSGEISGYGMVFQKVVEAASRMIGGLFADKSVETLNFPPLLSRRTLEKSRYLEAFPHLAGTVHCFCGDDEQHRRMLGSIAEGEDWAGYTSSAELGLTPAACYHVYPLAGARGPVPPQGLMFDVAAYCFRHEPSMEPSRLNMFRQREHVFIGTQAQVAEFQTLWLRRAMAALSGLLLPVQTDIANDAFFGRFRDMMRNAQRAQRLKIEILLPLIDAARLTACGSYNNHKTHFSIAFNLRLENGEYAQTACAGFGLERLAMALFLHLGFNLRDWPRHARETLGL